MPEETTNQPPQQMFAIRPVVRERVLRKLDLLPRGDVNDLCIELEQAPVINVHQEPPK